MKTLLSSIMATFAYFFFSASVFASSNIWEGVPLPEFELADQKGEIKTKNDFLNDWLILYFYPKDKTPGCTVEAQNFTNDYAKYKALGANIVGVSYDDVESHKDFADTYEIPFTLLADTDAKLSKTMKVNRILPWPHASRETFVINPEGIIVHHYSDVSPKSHSQELLEDLKSYQNKQSKKQ
ncbi:peroxiredoxin [Aliikangiella sp. G2MR2-5]|uniref:peroxiredoxin n=1 Tax=Aliikangiella sp. G2MR2-5 TaxID=2788943 RepID=UPI0018ABE963|nr:peroxiredoxin [Aliikangiella sp. G2MR2-5]